MSTINVLPKGFQEYLGNTSQGVNPSELNPNVQSGVDIGPFYDVDKMRQKALTANVSTPLTGAREIIPQGEVWSPVQLSGRITGLTIGDVVSIGVEIWDPAQNRTTLAVVPPFTATAVADNYAIAWSPTRQIWFPSGWSFASLVYQINIAQPFEVITQNLIYHRMLA